MGEREIPVVVTQCLLLPTRTHHSYNTHTVPLREGGAGERVMWVGEREILVVVTQCLLLPTCGRIIVHYKVANFATPKSIANKSRLCEFSHLVILEICEFVSPVFRNFYLRISQLCEYFANQYSQTNLCGEMLLFCEKVARLQEVS